MLQFKLVLPGPSASDVVTQEVTIKIGDAEAVVKSVSAADVEIDGFEGEVDAAVATSLVNIDGAGNRSAAREQTFTLNDTIPPAQPGEIGVVVTGQT